MTAKPDRLQWGFSSMGAAELDMPALGVLVRQHKLDFVELRTVAGSLDLPAYFGDHPDQITAAGVPVRLLASSLRLTSAESADLDVFHGYVKLAKAMKAPFIRVFGGEEWGTPITPELLKRAALTLEKTRALIDSENAACELVLETHSGFSSTKTCRQLNETLDEPISILWDSHHTWKLAGESLEESWAAVGPWVRHVHYKDSVLDPAHKAGYQYVPAGEGRFPTSELLALLHRVGYRGGVSLEWEKLWRPELPAIPVALEAFSRMAQKA